MQDKPSREPRRKGLSLGEVSRWGLSAAALALLTTLALPALAVPATCVVSGTVLDIGSNPVPNTAVRFRVISPTPPYATQDLTTQTANDGTWSLTLVQGLNAQVDIPAVAIKHDTVIPAGGLCPAAFTSLTLFSRGTLTPATILSTTGPSMGGDLTGSSPSPSVVGLRGVQIKAQAPTNGQALVYNSTSGKYEPSAVGGVGVGSVTAGTGISLTGSASAPVVNLAAGGVTATQLAGGACATNVGTVAGVLAGTLPNPTFAAGGITDAAVNASAGIAYTKLDFSGATPALIGAASSSTAVVSVTAGTGITMGGTATAPIVALSNGGVTPTQMAASAAAGNLGAAGGSLSGTYPAPTIAASAISDSMVNAAAGIANSKINWAGFPESNVTGLSADLADRLSKASGGTVAGNVTFGGSATFNGTTTFSGAFSPSGNVKILKTATASAPSQQKISGDLQLQGSVWNGGTGFAESRVAGFHLTPTALNTGKISILGIAGDDVVGSEVAFIDAISGAWNGPVVGNGAGTWTGPVIGNVTGNASGTAASITGNQTGDVTSTGMVTTVALVNGSTAANVHAAELLANAATDANTANAIVKRNAGNFSAGTITANLTGAVTGNATTASDGLTSAAGTAPLVLSLGAKALTGSVSDSSTIAKGIVQLAGDFNGTAASPGVASVGGQTAANVAAGAVLANAATAANTVSTILRRDGSNQVAATTFTGALAGNATSATTATTAGDGLTSASGTAPLVLNLAAKALTASLAVTPANPGGAVALQAATPGTVQTGHANFSGTVIAGAFSGPLTGNVTGNATGTAANVTGIVAVANGGTAGTTAATGRAGLLAVGTDGSNPLTSTWNAGNFAINARNTAGWFNVKAYGAVGDGSTDDTASCQAAITAAQNLIAGGGGSATVYFPSGQGGSGHGFAVSTLLITGAGITLLGDGGSMILGNTAGSYVVNFTGPGGLAWGNQVRGMFIGMASGVTATGTAALLRFYQQGTMRIDNVSLGSAYGTALNGLVLDSLSTGCVVNGVTSVVGAGTAVALYSNGSVQTGDVYMSNVFATGGASAFRFDGVSGFEGYGLNSYGSGYGFYFGHSGTYHNAHLFFSNCASDTSLHHNWWFNDGDGIRLTDCWGSSQSSTVTDTGAVGFFVSAGVNDVIFTTTRAVMNNASGFQNWGGTQIKFIGCTAENNNRSHVGSAGFFSANGATNVTFLGNTAWDTGTPKYQTYGLVGDGGGDYYVIEGNDFTGNLTGTISNLPSTANVRTVGNVGVADGPLGIGTATPAQMVDISSTAPSFQMTDTTAAAKSLRVVTDANVAAFYEAAGAAGDILSLDLANKRTGFGTTTPAQMVDISSAAPSFQMTDTTGAAKSLRLVTDANVANFYEAAGAAGDILTLDLANNRVGVGTIAPNYALDVKRTVTTTGTSDRAANAAYTASVAEGFDKIGLQGNAVFTHTSGTHSGGVGVRGIANATGSGGTTTSLRSLNATSNISTGAIVTERDGLLIADTANSGTLTTQYGVKVDSLAAGATNYAVYTAGTTPSYFGGNVGFGNATPAAPIDVIGNINQTSANAATWVHGQASELLVLSTGGGTTDTSANLLPANSVIRSVVVRVIAAITTASAFSVGDATIATRFLATGTGLTIGSTGVGLVHVDLTGTSGPRQTAAAKVRVTTTGTPGAGSLRITVFYDQFTAPTS